MFFVDGDYDFLTNNTAAHEFGHVLGLTDRYRYWANALRHNVTNQDSDGNLGPDANRDLDYRVGMGGTISAYLEFNDDNEYTTRYGWTHNLMSTLQKVGPITLPVLGTTPYRSIKQEITYKCFMFPFREIEAETNKTAVFVTQRQLEYIFAHQIEPDAEMFCFFRTQVGKDVTLQTFASNPNPNNNNPPFTDDLSFFVGFESINNPPFPVDSILYQPRHWSIERNDGKMRGRIRSTWTDNYNQINNSSTGRFSAYYSPYVSNNIIGRKLTDSIEPVIDSTLAFPTIYKNTKLTTIDELIFGGSVYNPILNIQSIGLSVPLGMNRLTYNHLVCMAFVELIGEIHNLNPWDPNLNNALTNLQLPFNITHPVSNLGIPTSSALNILSSNGFIDSVRMGNPLNSSTDVQVMIDLIALKKSLNLGDFLDDNFNAKQNFGEGNDEGKSIWNAGFNNSAGNTYTYQDRDTLNERNQWIHAYNQFYNFRGALPIYPSPAHLYRPISSSNLGDDKKDKIPGLNSLADITLESRYFYNRWRIISIINDGV